MDILNHLFGTGKEISMAQMCTRAFAFFFITLFYLRIAGLRTFGKKSSIDTIIVIILGSVIARGIAGASGFGATAASSLILVVTHRLLAYLTTKNPVIESIIKGKKKILYSNGHYVARNMTTCGLTKDYVSESLRISIQENSFHNIVSCYMETNGEISFVVEKK